jgi:hypothetical protein
LGSSQEERSFFFEKNNEKTFFSGAPRGAGGSFRLAKLTKFFASFSKKALALPANARNHFN